MTTETRRARPKREADPEPLKTEPDAWERFEKAMDKVVKAPPQHRSGRALESRGAPATPRKGKG